jgi:hypothetical protein
MRPLRKRDLLDARGEPTHNEASPEPYMEYRKYSFDLAHLALCIGIAP